MKRKFSDGTLSATEIEEIFRGAAAQGAEDVPTLSSANHPQNLQRSLFSAFGLPTGAPEIDFRYIPTASGNVAHPFMLPHRFFKSLYHERKSFWNRAVRGPIGVAAQFWAKMNDHPFVREHPYLEGVDRSKLLGLGLHGDAGSYSHNNSLYVFTWNSVTGDGQTLDTRFLMTLIRKDQIVPRTIDAIAKILGWSFNVLLTGIDPATDEGGRTIPSGGESYLADGWRAVLVRVRGDWEFYTSIFGAPHWGVVDRMCWLCGAVGDDDSHLCYTHCGEHASWRTTRVTHAQYLADLAARDEPVPAWYSHVHGLQIVCLMIDVLHAVDLGIFAHVIGNIF